MKLNNFILHFFVVAISTGQVSAQTNLRDTLNNPLENFVWNADEIIGLKIFKYVDQFNVISFDTINPKYPYGNITEFKNNKFTSHNQGFCGNECRVFVTGTYKVTGNKIDLFVNTIAYAKDCSGMPAEIINKPLGTFYWVKNEPGLRFLKDLRDLPNLDYLKKLQTHIPPFKYITSIQLISEFISVYDRYIKIVPNSNDNEYKAWRNELENWRLKAERYNLDAEKYKITDEDEYKKYNKIVKELNRILSDTLKRHIE